MTKVNKVPAFIGFASMGSFIIGIILGSITIIIFSAAIFVGVILWGDIIVTSKKKSEDESLSEDDNSVLQKEEDMNFINELIEMPSETAKVIYDFIRKNSSKYTTDVLTDLSSNGGSLLKKGETLPSVLIEIILTLNNEVIRLRTNQNALIKNWEKHFGEDLKKYQNLKVIDFR